MMRGRSAITLASHGRSRLARFGRRRSGFHLPRPCDLRWRERDNAYDRKLSEAEQVRHVVKAGFPAFAPLGCRDRAAREDGAVLGDMFKNETLMSACQDYLVLTDHSPAAKRRKPDARVAWRS